MKLDMFQVRRDDRKKKKLGKIQINRKKNMKSFLKDYNNDYTDSRYLAKLYTSDDEKFYWYLNIWLMTLNYDIYKKVSPISGKIINVLYKHISENSVNLVNGISKKLYRAELIKKTDIYLFKICEGNIICYPKFLSVSEKKEEAIKFFYEDKNTDLEKMCCSLIIIEYNINEGCKEQAASIEKYSVYDYEKEILFPPFSFFKIEKVYCDQNYYKGITSQPFVIELKVINRDFYIDQAILRNQKFIYDRKDNYWRFYSKTKIDNE